MKRERKIAEGEKRIPSDGTSESYLSNRMGKQMKNGGENGIRE